MVGEYENNINPENWCIHHNISLGDTEASIIRPWKTMLENKLIITILGRRQAISIDITNKNNNYRFL